MYGKNNGSSVADLARHFAPLCFSHFKFLFRFGPLVWRSSKERKRGQQLGRGGIFRSADSGIHVERSMAAESSDSRDTDPNEEPESPLVRLAD